MKRIVSLILVFLIFGMPALAETIVDAIPDTSQWGFSRTKFKAANGNGFQDIEIGGYKSLYLPAVEIDGYSMEGYYEFSSKQGNYYGLARVIYLLDISQKVSDANLKKCFAALVAEMTKTDEPTSTIKTRVIWEYSDCTMEISIGKYPELNGSNNKTVAVIFTAPDAGSSDAVEDATRGESKTMRVTASATCSDYNHVGNDWTQEYYVNGSKVSNGTTVSIAAGDTIMVSATITEEDKTPDIGSNSESYQVTQSDLKNGFTVNFDINVRENKGRYSGSTATWRVSFSFS